MFILAFFIVAVKKILKICKHNLNISI